MMKTSYALIGRWACGLMAGAALATAAQASTVLFSQSPVANTALYLSGTLAATPLVPERSEQSAESFTLAQSATITQVRWWGSDIAETTNLAVRFFATPATDDLAFTPLGGTIIKTATTNQEVFQLDLTLSSGLGVNAGNLYYLSVFGGNFAWGWQRGSGRDGESGVRDNDDSQSWTFAFPDLAFELIGDGNGTVPEPSALALSALALAALAASSRRRRLR